MVVPVATLDTCVCEPGYTGQQCGTLALPPPVPGDGGNLVSGLVIGLGGAG